MGKHLHMIWAKFLDFFFFPDMAQLQLAAPKSNNL